MGEVGGDVEFALEPGLHRRRRKGAGGEALERHRNSCAVLGCLVDGALAAAADFFEEFVVAKSSHRVGALGMLQALEPRVIGLVEAEVRSEGGVAYRGCLV